MTDSDEPENPIIECDLTLRDYFAGKALGGMNLSSNKPFGWYNWFRWLLGLSYAGARIKTQDAVERAYDTADAMLSQRKDGE